MKIDYLEAFRSQIRSRFLLKQVSIMGTKMGLDNGKNFDMFEKRPEKQIWSYIASSDGILDNFENSFWSRSR